LTAKVPVYRHHPYYDVTVLFIEDEPFSREKLLRVLGRRFNRIHSAVDSEEGFQLFQAYHPDLVIADLDIKQKSGWELVQKMRRFNNEVQIIVTADNNHHGLFMQASETGVNHLISKPIDFNQFLTAIQQSVCQIQLNQRIKSADPLTGSYNRSKFNTILAKEVSRAKAAKEERPFSIIKMAIDEFPKVKATCGRHLADEVLMTVSTIVQQRISANDVLARWSEEEFMILIPESDGFDALTLAESIKSIVEGFAFSKIGKVTCSFGAAEFWIGKSMEALLREAAEALHRSKQKGQNCVTLYSQEHKVGG